MKENREDEVIFHPVTNPKACLRLSLRYFSKNASVCVSDRNYFAKCPNGLTDQSLLYLLRDGNKVSDMSLGCCVFVT